jgi:branched-chain amino acid transport system ATP-binding protein
MLALARAYVQEARVVLVDEASMGLAPVLVDEIFVFLERISAAGTSLLIVEQYVSRALAIADRVYVLNKGTVVFSGGPKEIGDDIFDHYLGTAAGAH